MIGILGGTSFLETDALQRGQAEHVVTPYGAVEVVRAGNVAMIARHGRDGRTPPHRINHRAHLWALRQIGVTHIVAFGSVGGLRMEHAPGSQLLIDDLYAPFRVVTFHETEIKFTVPGFDPEWRGTALDAMRAAGLAITDGGTYAETLGPRFETVAEIRMLAQAADVVGMTCASEAVLARELGLPFALLATVDNYAHGIGAEPLTGDGFRDQVRENHDKVLWAFDAVLGINV